MGTSVSNLGGRQQIWNLGNNIIDTSNLVNLELQALEMKKTPYNNQKQTLATERNVYASMKKEFGSFMQVFKEMYAFKGNEKKAGVSKEGFINVQADASAIAGTYTINVKKVAERHQITTTLIDKSDSENPKNIIDLDSEIGKDATFRINDKEVKLTKEMTYKDFVNKMNNGNYGVSVYSLGGQLFFTSTTAGKNGEIKLVDGEGGILKDIGLVTSEMIDGKNVIAKQVTAPQNAEFIINGMTDSSPSNKIDTIPGLTINLEKETTEPIKVTIEDSNIKESINMIKKMRDQYNKAVSTLDLFAGENGAMQGNNIAFSISNIMANVFRHKQDDKFMFSFGIEVDKTGKMVLDEEKLSKAFKENPETAKQFFFGFNGLGHEIEKKLDGILGDEGVIGQRSKSIEGQIKELDKKIDAIDKLNKQKQETIIDKYSKLEQQLSMLDQQLKTIKAMTKQKSDD